MLHCEETPLTLEEMYTALLARFHRPPEPGRNGRGFHETPGGSDRVAVSERRVERP